MSILLLIFAISLVYIISESRHVLIFLLSVEMMSVGIYGLFCLRFFQLRRMVFCLVFLSFSVCEAALGLGLLASVVRGFGAEKSPSLFVLKY